MQVITRQSRYFGCIHTANIKVELPLTREMEERIENYLYASIDREYRGSAANFQNYPIILYVETYRTEKLRLPPVADMYEIMGRAEKFAVETSQKEIKKQDNNLILLI